MQVGVGTVKNARERRTLRQAWCPCGALAARAGRHKTKRTEALGLDRCLEEGAEVAGVVAFVRLLLPPRGVGGGARGGLVRAGPPGTPGVISLRRR
eukprot:1112501-Prorocentrum_minimum.AAC.1